jgi:PEP-CTERM motif
MRHSARLRQAATTLFLLAASTEIASANIVFDFSGACSSGCTGPSTSVLTLSDAYEFGTAVTDINFVSLSYASSDLSFTIMPSATTSITGSITSTGAIPTGFSILALSTPIREVIFEQSADDTNFHVTEDHLEGPATQDFGTNLVSTAAVPEPSTWAMLLLGFAGIGVLAYRRNTKPALTAA